MQFGRLGTGFGRLGGAAVAGVAVPRIRLSASTIAEDAAGDTEIGTASVVNGSGTYTFAITSDPDSKFSIVEATGVLSLATLATLDYETATSHSVTIEADNGVDDPISRTFTITVTNVLEVTLSALTLDADEIEEGSAAATVVGAVVGKTSGSTLSLTDDAGGRFALSGNNIVAGSTATDYDVATSHNITLRETHADGSNSPRDSVIAITVTEVGAVGAIGLLAAVGDSVTYDEGGGDPSYATQGAAILDPELNFDNIGVNGTGADDWLDDVAATIALFDAVPDDEPKIVTVMLGNTLDHESSSAAAINKAIEFFDAIRRSGNNIKVVQVADLSRGGTGGGFNSRRAVTNQWGRDSIGLYIDGFIDLVADLPTGMADDDANENPDWYAPGDNIHPLEAVHDAAAIVYAADIDAIVAAFLGDASAPTIARLFPVDGAIAVQAGLFPFVARFNEHVKFGSTVDIGIYRVPDDVLIEGWDETDIGSGIAIQGVDLEITPSAPLTEDEDYYILITSGSIEDISGNAFAGIAAKTTWNFYVPVAPVDDFLVTESGDRITLEDGTPILRSGTIPFLATATDLGGTEWAVLVQDGATVKCAVSDLEAYM